jgi:uncharacterized protein (TIGR03435 family)
MDKLPISARELIRQKMKLTFYAPVALVVICGNGYGQPPDVAKLQFEVASIKAAPPAGFFHSSDSGSGGPGSADPTTFHCATCTLSSLILKAFALERYQFPGVQSLPGDAFVISARIPAWATPEQFPVMLQNLLKDRFGLAYHFDKKAMQGYHLVVAKNGPKLIEAKAAMALEDSHGQQGEHSGWSHAAGGSPDGNHAATRPGLSFFNGGAQYRGDRQSTGELAQMLANQLAKPVDDQTGLTGKYDIHLTWSGESAHSESHPPGAFDAAGHDHGGGAGAGNSSKSADNDSSPTLFDALQSQLGLRLVAGSKSTAAIFVVDHIEKVPTGN